MDAKPCSKCDEVKPLNEFYKDKQKKDGHRPSCKVCQNKVHTAYRQTDEYKEYYKQRDRKQYFRRYRRNRYRNDSTFKLKVDMRKRMYAALNGNCKADTTEALLGCTFDEARTHIEAQFTEGMSWDKMGLHGIHIDHIRPCASFDLTDPEQQRQCFHYTNLQPLWAKDNMAKGDKWDGEK